MIYNLLKDVLIWLQTRINGSQKTTCHLNEPNGMVYKVNLASQNNIGKVLKDMGHRKYHQLIIN